MLTSKSISGIDAHEREKKYKGLDDIHTVLQAEWLIY